MTTVGLVGGGNITETHARAALAIPGLRIGAIAGLNSARVGDLCSRYGGAPCADLETLLDRRPIDLAVIGSPSGLHAAQATDIVRRGIPVLVEKPLDIRLDRIDALTAEAGRAGVPVGVLFQDRFKPGLLWAKALVDEGAIGTPILVRAEVPWYRPPEYYAASRWRGTWALDGGGAAMNQGIHTVDLLLWLLGDIVRVHGRTATRLHRIEVEDTAFALFEFAGGTIGSYMATTAAYPGSARRVSVTGTAGSLTIEGDEVTAVVRLDGVPVERPSRDGGASSEAPSSAVVADITPHRSALEDFVRVVEHGGTPRCDARDGRRSVAVVRALYESSDSGRWADVSGHR